jgi:phosphohistidine phosphatase
MKHLLLLRHAKSSWAEPGLPDIERPLTKRGKRDAGHIGEALRKRGLRPDLVVASPARRARKTATIVVRTAHLTVKPQIAPAVYAASSDELIEVVRALPDSAACALLVGHNPGFEELLGRLTGERAPMPTATLACVALECGGWKGVADGAGRLLWRLTPENAA